MQYSTVPAQRGTTSGRFLGGRVVGWHALHDSVRGTRFGLLLAHFASAAWDLIVGPHAGGSQRLAWEVMATETQGTPLCLQYLFTATNLQYSTVPTYLPSISTVPTYSTARTVRTLPTIHTVQYSTLHVPAEPPIYSAVPTYSTFVQYSTYSTIFT